MTVDLTAAGPWISADKPSADKIPMDKISAEPNLTSNPPSAALPIAENTKGESLKEDSLSGTVVLHNANWKAEYLANHLTLSQATLHLSDSESRWEPVEFTYGPVKGRATLSLPLHCEGQATCLPKFQVEFTTLDASALQSAILGAQEPGTLLSTLIARIHPTAAPSWPSLEGTVKADSFLLGSLTLATATATVRIAENHVEILSLDAALLGGHLHAAGALRGAEDAQQKPSYSLTVQGDKLNPQAIGQLLGQHWSGGPFAANGKMDLSGYLGSELAASAKGTLHLDWQHGAVASVGTPAALARFDRWSADAEIANGAVTLKQNQVQRGAKTATVEATAPLAVPLKLAYSVPK